MPPNNRLYRELGEYASVGELLIRDRLSGEAVAASFTTGDPNGTPGNRGQLMVDQATNAVWQNTTGGTVWALFGAGGSGDFGTGRHGTVVFDGVATILGLVPSAATPTGSISVPYYTLAQDLYLEDCTINANVLVHGAGHRIFVRGALVLNGYIGAPGFNGGTGTATVGGVGGSSTATNGTLANRAGGGAGATPGGGSLSGGAVIGSPREFDNTGGTNSAIIPTPASCNGGAGKGGAGGGGGSSGLAAGGGNGGTVSVATAGAGDLDALTVALTGSHHRASTYFSGGSGGGGGKGCETGNGAGGGGGSGGQPFVLCARSITGTGQVIAWGGDGGNGFQGAISAGQRVGGGAGGGGAWLVVVVGTGAFPAVSVIGGIGGQPNPAAGAGGVGGSGGGGITKLFRIGA